MISQQALQEFKQIWKNQIGTDISDEQAMEEAANLLTMFDTIYRPVKKEWIKGNDNDRTPIQPTKEQEV
jgi:hypothetical protein